MSNVKKTSDFIDFWTSIRDCSKLLWKPRRSLHIFWGFLKWQNNMDNNNNDNLNDVEHEIS